MKVPVVFFLGFLLVSCKQTKPEFPVLQAQIDSLQQKLNKTYRPGLGEFMLDIQIHHAKLWFASQAENWSLSNFESKEIRESINDIETYCSDRSEVALISMLNPSLDSIDQAISKKNISEFNGSFILLTNTCNNCHRVTKYEFNVIQIPTSSSFTNQTFKISTGMLGKQNK
jgi:hypothetical protein